MFWYLMSTFSLAIAGIIVYIYYLKNGQFEDSEDVKYQLFREDEEQE